MSRKDELHCSLCGRLENQVKALYKRRTGLICDECDGLRIMMYGEGDGELEPHQRERDAAIFDEYRRYDVEVANQSSLRAQFGTGVDEPKDPAEKERLRAMAGEEMGSAMKAHPILQDKVQFNGINENIQLPSMDPEQLDNYLQHQLQLQNQKRLQKQNEASMKPSGPQ